MQISVSVPYDEAQLRRTLQFILRPQMKLIRILGGVLLVLGLALVALEPSDSIAYAALALGLAFLVLIAPITLSRSVRMQSKAIKEGYQLTLTDEWLAVTYPLAETRFRWAGVDRIVETPEVWYGMVGKIQAIPIPKDRMTEEQRAEFAAFVSRLPATKPRV